MNISGDNAAAGNPAQARSADLTRGRFFGGLVFAALINAVAGLVVLSVQAQGIGSALFTTFGFSPFLWLGFAAALHLLLSMQDDLSRRDVMLGIAASMLIAVPIDWISWLAVTVIGLYLLAGAPAGSLASRAGWVLLALPLPLFWSRVLGKLFGPEILQGEASLVSTLAGASFADNRVTSPDGFQELVIYWPCSSLHSILLVLLAWTVASRYFGHRSTAQDALWIAAGIIGAIAINIARLTIMARSSDYYDIFHTGWGADLVSACSIGLTAAICVWGLRGQKSPV